MKLWGVIDALEPVQIDQGKMMGGGWQEGVGGEQGSKGGGVNILS